MAAYVEAIPAEVAAFDTAVDNSPALAAALAAYMEAELAEADALEDAVVAVDAAELAVIAALVACVAEEAALVAEAAAAMAEAFAWSLASVASKTSLDASLVASPAPPGPR